MMRFYKINFEQFSQEPENVAMLKALERGLVHFNIDFYLIGAVARDVWMRGIYKIAPRRTTADIDFAVLMNDKGVYERLKEYLIRIEGFQPYSGNSFVLLFQVGFMFFRHFLKGKPLDASFLGMTGKTLLFWI